MAHIRPITLHAVAQCKGGESPLLLHHIMEVKVKSGKPFYHAMYNQVAIFNIGGNFRIISGHLWKCMIANGYYLISWTSERDNCLLRATKGSKKVSLCFSPLSANVHGMPWRSTTLIEQLLAMRLLETRLDFVNIAALEWADIRLS